LAFTQACSIGTKIAWAMSIIAWKKILSLKRQGKIKRKRGQGVLKRTPNQVNGEVSSRKRIGPRGPIATHARQILSPGKNESSGEILGLILAEEKSTAHRVSPHHNKELGGKANKRKHLTRRRMGDNLVHKSEWTVTEDFSTRSFYLGVGGEERWTPVPTYIYHRTIETFLRIGKIREWTDFHSRKNWLSHRSA